MAEDRRKAFVTGASRGIGKAIAVALGRAGFDIAITARTVEPGEEREHSPTAARSQYGGFFRVRCAFAASTHQVRSSANRGKAFASALPPSPIGLPSSESVCTTGPAEMVEDTTTMPISESVPCHITAARAPAKRPA